MQFHYERRKTVDYEGRNQSKKCANGKDGGTTFPRYYASMFEGHKITGRYLEHPELRRDRCEQCGKQTTIKCLSCQANIKGYLHYPSVISSDDSKVPIFCDSCGEPFPWGKVEEAEFLAADHHILPE